MKKARGVKKGETPAWKVGRKAGTAQKTETFLGVRVTTVEKNKMKQNFEKYKKKHELKSGEAIIKIFTELENIL